MIRLIASCFILISAVTGAQGIISQDPVLGLANISLYDGPAPGGQDPADQPILRIFSPQPGMNNGSGVIIAPGGAYVGLASNLDGRQVADWFTARASHRLFLIIGWARTTSFPFRCSMRNEGSPCPL